MKHMKKLTALLVSLAMLLGMAGALAEDSKTYGGNDVSEHVDIVLYYVGNPIGDEEMVFARVNEIMNEKINATINFKALDMSSYAQKYDLLLSGKEDVDLIYTSGWCYYIDEAGKGAFLEITDEMIEKYMPQTFATQATASYTQGIIDGKLYYMPACKIGYGHPTVLIRGDLREKYGLEPLKTPADLTAYMKAVGMNTSMIKYGLPITAQVPVSSVIGFIALIPDYEVSTREARAVLPDSYTRSDAVFNLSRLGVLLRAFETGDLMLIGQAMDDRIHQSFRLPLIHDYDMVHRICRDAGASAFCISGSGSTCLAVVDVYRKDLIAAQIREALAESSKEHWRIEALTVDRIGARVAPL